MSKKMLKRSLALGALMAFVITGSAMAEETLSENTTLTQIVTISGNNINSSYAKTGMNGNNLTIVRGDSGHAYAVGVEDYSFTGGGNLTIENNYANNAGYALHGFGTIEVADLNIKAVQANAIYANGLTKIGAANNIVLDAAGSNGNAITVETDKEFNMSAGNNIKMIGGNRIIRVAGGSTTGMSAQNIYMNTNEDGSVTNSLNDDAAIKVDSASTLTIGDENTQNIYLSAESSKDERFNAILLEDAGTSVTLNGNANITVTNSVGRADAIKVDGGTLTFNDSATITTTTTATDKQAYGIVAMNEADVNLANTKITTIGKGLTIGVVGSNGADIDLEATTIKATSEGSRADGMNLENCKEMNVAGTLNITAVGNGVHDNAGAQGIRLAYTSATFADDVEIDVTSNQEGVNAYGLNILSDTNFPLSNAVFKDNVTIDVKGGNVFSVLSSGSHPAGVTFEKGDVTIEATAGGASAVGVAAAYNSSVKATADTDVTITATAKKGLAQAVNNTLTKGADGWYGNGKIELLGNVELIAKGKDADNSLAIYNEYYDGYGNGTTVVGSEGKKVVIDGNILTECGSVTVNFGAEGSQFDGKVTTKNIDSNNANFTKGTTTLNFANGSIWNLKGASTLTNATFDAGSTLVIDGKTYEYVKDGDNVYALNGVGSNSKLTVKDGAKLTVTGIKETTYNIANGFATVEGTKVDETTTKYWDVNDVNTLMQGVLWNNGENGLQLEVYAKPADTLSEEMNVSESTATSLTNVTTAAQAAEKEGIVGKADGTGKEKAVAFINAMSGVDSKVAGQAFEAVSKMAEAGGNSGTAASIVKNVTGVTNDRLSFNCGHSAPHKGGHGVGLFEEGSGADVWVEYVHGKDEVEDMPSTAGASSYEGQYNGIVMGVDFKKVNKFQSGLAFNYGEGDTNSVGSVARTHSDYDFWGIGYYGSIHNDDSNVIFDIGYAKTDSDVENTSGVGVNFKASPETTTWTAGVKVEKLYQNENVQIVPYTGLRFMSIDPEDYSTECASASYQMERQNVWLLPFGVSIRQEIANDNGWTVSPKVDLSYIWAFGDTDSEMEFSTLGTKTNIGYEVMDDGSFLGLVGIEAHKGQWGFGVSYSYQKGDYSTSKKWFIDANYSF